MVEVTPTTAATAAAPTHLPLPSWHPVYSAFRRVVEGIQRRYAATALAKIKTNQDALAALEAERFASQQFQLASTLSQTSMSTSSASRIVLERRHAQMSESDAMLTNASSCVYCVEKCRPKQLDAANKILFDPTSLGKLGYVPYLERKRCQSSTSLVSFFNSLLPKFFLFSWLVGRASEWLSPETKTMWNHTRTHCNGKVFSFDQASVEDVLWNLSMYWQGLVLRLRLCKIFD